MAAVRISTGDILEDYKLPAPGCRLVCATAGIASMGHGTAVKIELALRISGAGSNPIHIHFAAGSLLAAAVPTDGGTANEEPTAGGGERAGPGVRSSGRAAGRKVRHRRIRGEAPASNGRVVEECAHIADVAKGTETADSALTGRVANGPVIADDAVPRG